MACERALTVSYNRLTIRLRHHHCTVQTVSLMTAAQIATLSPARCLPAANNILSEEYCRLQIVVDTCCGAGAPHYLPIAPKIYNKRHVLSKNRGSWGLGTVL